VDDGKLLSPRASCDHCSVTLSNVRSPPVSNGSEEIAPDFPAIHPSDHVSSGTDGHKKRVLRGDIATPSPVLHEELRKNAVDVVFEDFVDWNFHGTPLDGND
jgi:hypothetical protein